MLNTEFVRANPLSFNHYNEFFQRLQRLFPQAKHAMFTQAQLKSLHGFTAIHAIILLYCYVVIDLEVSSRHLKVVKELVEKDLLVINNAVANLVSITNKGAELMDTIHHNNCI